MSEETKSGLACPRCGGKMEVHSTIKGNKTINRYRSCTNCPCKIYTEEKALRVTSKETFKD